jgi:hypothetical protein
MVDETRDEVIDNQITVKNPSGDFIESLVRSNSKIKRDRAEQIGRKTATAYKRAVEDIQEQIDELVDEQIGMMDLSPTNTQSLTLASDFDSAAYTQKDIDIEIKLRNLRIKRECAASRLKALFGITID